MEVQVVNFGKTGKAKAIQISDAIFAVPMNEDLVHQIATAHRNARRQGAPDRKNRSDVSGSTLKPWRQKGTGRARAGSRTGPLWRGGGVTFSARTKDYSQKVNRKMYRGAVRCILSERFRTNRITVLDTIALADHKTKTCKAWLDSLNVNEVLIVTEGMERNLLLAARNLPNVGVVEVKDIDPIALLHVEHMLVTEQALKTLEESFV